MSKVFIITDKVYRFIDRPRNMVLILIFYILFIIVAYYFNLNLYLGTDKSVFFSYCLLLLGGILIYSFVERSLCSIWVRYILFRKFFFIKCYSDFTSKNLHSDLSVVLFNNNMAGKGRIFRKYIYFYIPSKYCRYSLKNLSKKYESINIEPKGRFQILYYFYTPYIIRSDIIELYRDLMTTEGFDKYFGNSSFKKMN